MKTTEFGHPTDERPGRVRGLAWLMSIIGVFAVCLFLAWLVGKENSPLSSHGERYAMASDYMPHGLDLSKYANQQGSNQLVAYVMYQQPALIVLPNVNVTGKIGAQAAQPMTTAKKTVTKEVSSATANTVAKSVASDVKGSASDADRIEREAREVIHGDYGDNPMRQEKLGADYAAVQARVNEILHHS